MPADYIQISSGLGEAPPLNIVVLPVVFEGEVKAVIELASFDRFSEIHLAFLDQLTRVDRHRAQHDRGQHAHRGAAQAVAVAGPGAAEPAGGADETNKRLEKQAATLQRVRGAAASSSRRSCSRPTRSWRRRRQLLAQQKAEVERKNREIELARRALEEKAEQLALTSKYKSEFLANMSHELRTPLNSLLILAKHARRTTPRAT